MWEDGLLRRMTCIIRFVDSPDATLLSRTVLTFPGGGRMHEGTLLVDKREWNDSDNGEGGEWIIAR